MARKRMIDPAIWEDEHFAMLSDKAKILFIACFSNADDDGRLSAHGSNLRAMAFRFENLSLKKVEELTQEISKKLENFKIYAVNGCKYIQLTKWEDYQKQKKDRRIPSKIPPCPPDVRQMSDRCPPNVGQMATQDKLSKDKLSKDKLSKNNNSISSSSTIFADFEKSALSYWNSFCSKYPTLSKIKELSGRRRMKLKLRYGQASFKDFEGLLRTIEAQPFLLGENDRHWRVSFDWLIENDTNYLKVLERKYEKRDGKSNQLKEFEEMMKDGKH